jgi:hypothetical protein
VRLHKPVSSVVTNKQIRASASAAFITHIIETKGLDAYDHAKAKAAGESSSRVQEN